MTLVPIIAASRPQLVEFEAGTNPRDRTLNPLKVDSVDIRQWIERRDPRPIGHWNEIGSDEHARAFTAARTAGHDIIDDLYFAFYDTVASGGTEVDFEKLVLPILRQKGWLADKPGVDLGNRVRLIYDTNLRVARGAGRWARYWRSRSALPYLRAVTVRDDRVRRPPKSEADHTAWDGIILPIEHEFWTRWFPPLGFRCRCSIIPMTRSQLARYKGGITSAVDLADREARLGVPIFASPAAGIDSQLSSMVEATNTDAMPGLPPVDPRETRRLGASIWSQIIANEALKGIDDVLARIFGQAA